MTDQSDANEGQKIRISVERKRENLTRRYIKHREEDIKALGQAIAQHDFGTIQMLGHKMNGSGGGYRFWGITEIGKLLEKAGKDKVLEAAEEQLGELANYLEHLEIVYE